MKKRLLYFGLLMSLLSFGSQFEGFLNSGIGVNSIAMGQACYNSVDCESGYYNPALISALKQPQGRVASNRKFGDMDEMYVSVVIPFDIATFGLTYFTSQIGNSISGVDYDGTNLVENGQKHSYFTSLTMLSLGKQLHQAISVGVNIKNFVKNLSVAHADAWAMDMGVNMILIPNKINVSLKAANVMSTSYQWETTTEKPELEYIAGVGFENGPLKLNIGCIIIVHIIPTTICIRGPTEG